MKAATKVALTGAIAIVAKGRGGGQELLRLTVARKDEQPRQAILSINAYLTALATIRALHLPLVSGMAQREFQARVQSELERAVTFCVGDQARDLTVVLSRACERAAEMRARARRVGGPGLAEPNTIKKSSNS